MSNDETAAVQAWKILVSRCRAERVYPRRRVNNWIAFFGTEEDALRPNPQAGDDQLGYLFPAALGSRYESCSPNPIEYENLEFVEKIKLELKRDKSGGGCG
jgi:hypothetical protein